MLHCRLIYMLSILGVRLTIKVKVGIPESFNVGWYPLKKTGSSHLNTLSKVLEHLAKNGSIHSFIVPSNPIRLAKGSWAVLRYL